MSTLDVKFRLASSSPSLFNATFYDSSSREPLYELRSDMISHETSIRRGDGVSVARVIWATSGYPASVLFKGERAAIPVDEFLTTSAVLGQQRKFRVGGFTDAFKWKKASKGWVCYSAAKDVVATLELFPSSIHLEMYPLIAQPTTSSRDQNVSPDQSLLDSLIVTALLLISPVEGFFPGQPQRSPRQRLTSMLTSSSASLKSKYDASSMMCESRSTHSSRSPRSPRRACEIDRETNTYNYQGTDFYMVSV